MWNSDLIETLELDNLLTNAGEGGGIAQGQGSVCICVQAGVVRKMKGRQPSGCDLYTRCPRPLGTRHGPDPNRAPAAPPARAAPSHHDAQR